MRTLLLLIGLLASWMGVANAAPIASAVTFTPDGTLLVGYTNGALERWRVRPETRVSRVETGAGEISDIRVSPDGQRIATTSKKGVRVVGADLGGGVLLRGATSPVGFRADGMIVTGRGGRGLTVWRVRGTRATPVDTLLATRQVYDLSADAQVAATAKGAWEVQSWSLAEPAARRLSLVKIPCWGGITGVSLSRDGRFVCGLASTEYKPPDAFAQLFDVRSGKKVAYRAVGTNVDAAAVSADGQLLMVFGSLEGVGALAARDIPAGKDLWSINFSTSRAEDAEGISTFALSPDGRWMVTAGRSGVRLWDARDGTVLAKL